MENYFGDLTVAAAGELDDFTFDELMAELNKDPQYVADMEAKRMDDLLYQMSTELF